MLHALRTVFVCKNLPGDQYRQMGGPQLNAQVLLIGKSKGIDGLKLPLRPLGLAPGDRAGGCEGHDEVVAQVEYGVRVPGRGVPTVGQKVAVGHLLLGHAQHRVQVFVLGVFASGLDFLRFGVHHGPRLFDEFHGDGQDQRASLVEQAPEVEAFDKEALAVVPMRAN